MIQRLTGLGAALLLAGCAGLQVDRNVEEAGKLSREPTATETRLVDSDSARQDSRVAVDKLLQSPLGMEDAVRIALVHSAAAQAMLFESAAASAATTQSTRLANPVFTFDRLARGSDLEIGRMLAFSVLDVFLLPERLRAADFRQQQLQLRAAGDIVQAAAEARQAWIRAVAAAQSVAYAREVKAAAEAGAELARRMQSAGNFSKLQRAREQSFYADAVTQVARADQAATAAREALVRTLGLDRDQAERLKVPDRLPDFPAQPKAESEALTEAVGQRLDVRMAQAELEYLGRTMGLTRVTSVVDALHVAPVRNSDTGNPVQKGYEIEVPLPLFDFGDARRAEARARYLAALNRAAAAAAQATSHARQSYATYRTAFDVARHYRTEVLPLRKLIADEALLKYNGMLIGVFELLAESRSQVGAVMQALDAERDFWLADAELRASIVGRPLGTAIFAAAPTAGAATTQETH